MASDASTRKHKPESAHAAASIATAAATGNLKQYTHSACALCAQTFDDATRAPRLVACGHTFCTACVGARMLNASARRWYFACPVDGDETRVGRGNPVNLARAELVSAKVPLIRVHLKNMAVDVISVFATEESTVGDIKRLLRRADPMYVVHLQRLFIQGADDVSIVLDDDAATLGALGIGGERVVSVVMRDGFRGGEFVRTIGSRGSGAGQFSDPWGVCASPDGEHLFVSDSFNYTVQVMRLSDGVHVRTLDAFKLNGPVGMCISHDGVLLFIVDLGRQQIQVLRTADGVLVRSIGAGPLRSETCQFRMLRGVCVSRDGEFVYAAEQYQNRVQVFRVSDGAHMRSIALSDGYNTTGASGMCLSPCGNLLFVNVNENFNNGSSTPQLIILRTSDGLCVSSTSVSCEQGLSSGICVSSDGELLFVCLDTSAGDPCVKVIRTSDGAIVHTIDSRSSGGRLGHTSGVCVSPSGDRLYMTSADGIVLELTI